MSATVSAPIVTVRRLPWPRLALRRGSNVLEVDGPCLFLRLGRVAVYARRRAAYDPRWDAFREPGSAEVYGFGLGLTVAWAPVSGVEDVA